MSPRSKEANKQVLDERRSQILNAALKVFAEQGFAATKISNIASEAGLSHGLLYHYFNTKEEIFIELVRTASNIFLAITEYGAKYDASPVEKIRIITEMIISIGYSNVCAYYLNIFEQAFISEGIPDTARKIINDNLSANINLITGILKEGQKQGQIFQDDPLKLAFAYYSMVRGMTGMQSKQVDYHNKHVSFSDSDIIMRAIVNHEYEEPAHIHSKGDNIFGPIQSLNKSLKYRHKLKTEKDFITYQERAVETSVKGQKRIKIEFFMDIGVKMTAIVDPTNWIPYKVQYVDSGGSRIQATEYKNNTVTFYTPENSFKKEIRLTDNYYDHNTIAYLLQAYPFASKEKIQLTLILDGTKGLPIGPYGVEIENLGVESVSVPAGDFDCYRLEITPVGFDFSKFYYWYPVDEPRFMIKRDILGMESELIEVI